MSMLQQLWPKCGGNRDKNLALMQNKIIHHRPVVACSTGHDLLPLGHHYRQGERFLLEGFEQLKLWAGDRTSCCARSLLITLRQIIGNGVQFARLVLHLKAVAKQLAYPSMLRDSGKALV